MAAPLLKNEQRSSRLERGDIQGMLLSAYGHLAWSANVLLRIDDAARARPWLASLADSITTARGKHHGRCVNVAFSHRGLLTFGLPPDADPFAPAFLDGMASPRRARILNDTGRSAPATWEWGTVDAPVDALLMLFAHEKAALETVLAEHRTAFGGAGLRELGVLETRRHYDGREHFGFSDGVAQPAIRGEQRSEPARRRTNDGNDVAAGEFILGYQNEYGLASPAPAVRADSDPRNLLGSSSGVRNFGLNGSYLVVRQLEQDVAGFWNFLHTAAAATAAKQRTACEPLAAKFIGRWPSGAPLINAPDADDAQFANDNDFGFAGDPNGDRCPIGAHIRRANPRDCFTNDSPEQALRRSNRHRLLRRGRPYGERIDDDFTNDDVPRGLIFMCLNGDIERQFEFVQQTWLNNPAFCGLRDEVDPLVSTQAGGSCLTIPGGTVRTRVKDIPAFVTTRGGGYFFLPGLRALRYLGALA